jgi:GGDEF domain-containing protein
VRADISLMFSKRRKEPEGLHEYDLDEVLKVAAQGRRLAIYDRGTNLYAYWYLQLRGDEENARARRYGKPLSFITLWAATPALIERLAAHLHEHLRDTDLAGYLNNGHFVVVLCETPRDGARIVLDRALESFGGEVDGACVAYPDDGESFDTLLEAAKARASSEIQRRSA